jgi:ATP-dependent helicase/nuclease subunit A
MTRAEDRLIVCGYHGKFAPKPGTWHDGRRRACRAAAGKALPHPRSDRPKIGAALPRDIGRRPPATVGGCRKATPPSRVPLPAQLFETLPAKNGLPRPLSPSGASTC